MHRVSISPEIRDLFQEHEALRGMAVRAARNVSVPPELEEAVFARVQALHDEEERIAKPIIFWNIRKFSVVAGALAIVFAGTIGSMEFRSKSDVKLSTTTSQTSIARIMQSSGVSDRPTVSAAHKINRPNSSRLI